MGQQRRFQTRAGAFSLVELLMVTALVAVVAAIAVPRYAHALSRYRVDAAAGRVVVELELARAKAQAASGRYRVAFDVLGEHIQTQGPLAASPQVISEAYLQREPYGVDLQTVGLASDEVVFNGFGFPDRSGQIVVADGMVSQTVTINHTTGEVTSP